MGKVLLEKKAVLKIGKFWEKKKKRFSEKHSGISKVLLPNLVR